MLLLLSLLLSRLTFEVLMDDRARRDPVRDILIIFIDDILENVMYSMS